MTGSFSFDVLFAGIDLPFTFMLCGGNVENGVIIE